MLILHTKTRNPPSYLRCQIL